MRLEEQNKSEREVSLKIRAVGISFMKKGGGRTSKDLTNEGWLHNLLVDTMIFA
jgi:hypothetical protein